MKSHENQLRFDGRVALINYADNPIGIEAGRLLVDRGASVMFNDSTGTSESAVEALRRPGAPIVFASHDLTQMSGASAAVGEVVAALGRIDIVVNAAGSASIAPFAELTTETVTNAWLSRVTPAFGLLKAAWPVLTAQGYGRVINVGSYAGLVSGEVTGAVADDISQGGFVGMTRALAAAGSPQAVLVNEVLADGEGPAAALIAWLAHESCDGHGRFYVADTTGVAEVFTSAGAGYQCPQPSAFSLENIDDNWAAIQSPDGGVSPVTSAEYTTWRNAIYAATVTA